MSASATLAETGVELSLGSRGESDDTQPTMPFEPRPDLTRAMAGCTEVDFGL